MDRHIIPIRINGSLERSHNFVKGRMSLEKAQKAQGASSSRRRLRLLLETAIRSAQIPKTPLFLVN